MMDSPLLPAWLTRHRGFDRAVTVNEYVRLDDETEVWESTDQVLLAVVNAAAAPLQDPEGILSDSNALQLAALAERIMNSAFTPRDPDTFIAYRDAALLSGILTNRRGAECRVDQLYAAWDSGLAYGPELVEAVGVSIDQAHVFIDVFEDLTADIWADGADPDLRHEILTSPRPSYTPAERRIAEDHGLAEPVPLILHGLVRRAALESRSEASFIRYCRMLGVQLTPRINPDDQSVTGMSCSLIEGHRREYAAGKLSRTLTLPRLRPLWVPSCAASRGRAWAAWNQDVLHREPPPAPSPGRWRWAPEDTPSALAAPPDQTTHRGEVWAWLFARQSGACAMCTIRWHHWSQIRDTTIPPELLRPPTVVDHDHDTGLVRGLLCNWCNSDRDPFGAARGDYVAQLHRADPPAAGHHWMYANLY